MKKIVNKTFFLIFILVIAFSFSVDLAFANENDIEREKIEIIAEELGIDPQVLYESMDSNSQNDYRVVEQNEYREVNISGIPSNFSFNRNLSLESEGSDVKYLQILLNTDPDTMLTNYGYGAPGRETAYYGSLTENAVRRFQNKYSEDILKPQSLNYATGKVDYYTRVKLNEILGKDTTSFEYDNSSSSNNSSNNNSNDLLVQLQELSKAMERISQRLDEMEKGGGYQYDGQEGELSVENRYSVRNEEVRSNQRKEVAEYRLEAENSDITVHRFDLFVKEAVDGSMTDFRSDIDKIALKANGKVLDEVDVDRSNIDRDDEYIRFSGFNVEIREGRYEDFTIEVTADDGPFNQTKYNIGPTEDQAIRGRDGAGLTIYGSSNSYVSFYLEGLSNARLEINDDNSPEEGLVQVDKDYNTEVKLLSFELVSEDDDADLETLIVNLEGDDSNAGISFDGTNHLQEIFQDLLLYNDGDLIDIADVDDDNGDGKAEVEFQVDLELEEGREEEFEIIADVFSIDPDNSSEVKRLGTRIKASINEENNEDVAYGYNADDYISLRDDLEGEWQELYYVLPKFKLNDDDIDTDSDKNFADGLMSIDLEAIGGDITLTAINVKDEGVYDQGSYLTGSGWDVVIEIDGSQVYTTSDGENDGYGNLVDEETIEEDEEVEIEIFGVNDSSGWVRLAIDSIEWENEYGETFSWDDNYDIIDELKTDRIYITN
jgi:hypothetical protein